MRAPVIASLLALAACASQPKPTPVGPAARPLPGMDRLMGQGVESAIALLGQARLDRREGPARQLQFAGSCILDLFYYPRGDSMAVATYAAARLPDGRPMAPGDCLDRLLRTDASRS